MASRAASILATESSVEPTFSAMSVAEALYALDDARLVVVDPPEEIRPRREIVHPVRVEEHLDLVDLAVLVDEHQEALQVARSGSQMQLRLGQCRALLGQQFAGGRQLCFLLGELCLYLKLAGAQLAGPRKSRIYGRVLIGELIANAILLGPNRLELSLSAALLSVQESEWDDRRAHQDRREKTATGRVWMIQDVQHRADRNWRPSHVRARSMCRASLGLSRKTDCVGLYDASGCRFGRTLRGVDALSAD